IILCLVFPFSWFASVLLLITAPVIPLFWAIIGAKAQKAAKDQWQEMGAMNGYLLDRLRGIKTLHILNAIHWSAKRLARQSDDLIVRTMKVLRIAFLSSAVLELFSALGVALMAVYIGFHLLGVIDIGFWGNKLTLAEGLFILLLAPSFFEPLRELASVWHDRVSGKAAIENFRKLVEEGPKIIYQTDIKSGVQNSQTASPNAIEIKNLTFGFLPGNLVFDRFSLAIKQGEKIAVTGRSGIGKSVLLGLIAGLVKPQSGSIAIDGLALDATHVGSIRTKIGWMGAKPYWFEQSVLSNITLNRAQTDIDQYLCLANLPAFTGGRKYQRLGEGGMGVSGGEAARLALARLACQTKRKILLIDEPTAHLDPESARTVVDALIKISRNHTLIVATHDPYLVRHMDRVVALDKRKVDRKAFN
uniref:ABC transporter ATP-binding protein/permease n=1 Tax=uncultured Bartonella sp. TaxID=104108 RepID=UPI00262E6FD4